MRVPIRVLLADDHALVRSGVRALLEKIHNVDVVAEAGTGPDALAMARKHRPDVPLIHIAMPGMRTRNTKEIAFALDISVKTVETHRA